MRDVRDRLVDLWLRSLARLVPRSLRDRWLEEWRGEVWHGVDHRAPSDPAAGHGASPRRRTADRAPRAVRRRRARHLDVLGALRDALATRGVRSTGRIDGHARRRAPLLEPWLQDLRAALRSLASAPGTTAVTVTILAIGIGATTTILGVVDTVVWRPLHLERPGELVLLGTRGGASPVVSSLFAETRVEELERHGRTLVDVEAAIDSAHDNVFYLTGTDEPERLTGALVTPGYFDLLGAEPAAGRLFSDADGPEIVGRVAVLHHGLWVRRFAADPAIVGRTIRLDGIARVVVGVLPADFELDRTASRTARAEVWVPMAAIGRHGASAGPSGPDVTRQGPRQFDNVVARLAPGASPEEASQELTALHRSLDGAQGDREIVVQTLRADLVGAAHRPLAVVAGIAALVLLLVCLDAAGLQLARATERVGEMEIRSALGATRARLVRQLTLEGLLAALAGGVLALLLAGWSTRLVVALAPELPRIEQAGPDLRVAALGTLVAVLSGLACGVLPARATTAAATAPGSGRGAAAGGPRLRRWRTVLVAGQVAAATVLLVGGGLVARSWAALQDVDHGMQTDDVLVVDAYLSLERYPPGSPAILGYFDELAATARAHPGVEAIALTSSVPFRARDYYVQGDWRRRVVDPGYFELLGIPVLRGRGLTAADGDSSPPAVVINESLARHRFGDGDPLGRRLDEDEDSGIVVGVVADTRHVSPDAAPLPAEYQPLARRLDHRMSLLLRTAGDPRSVAQGLLDRLRGVDPDQPLANLSTLDAVLGASPAMAARRFNLQLLLAFGLVAMVLTATALYGVLARSVAQRRGEIGVRRALGATDAEVWRMVVRHGMGVVLVGAALGVGGALALGRLLEHLLYDVDSGDPLTLGIVVAALLAVALAATMLPAQRAVRVDPVVALRGQAG